jgi:hypothetical protein
LQRTGVIASIEEEGHQETDEDPIDAIKIEILQPFSEPTNSIDDVQETSIHVILELERILILRE